MPSDRQLKELFESYQKQLDTAIDLVSTAGDAPLVKGTVTRRLGELRELSRRQLAFAFPDPIIVDVTPPSTPPPSSNRPSIPVRMARNSIRAVSQQKESVIIATILSSVITMILKHFGLSF